MRRSVLIVILILFQASFINAQDTAPAPIRFNFKDLFLIKDYKVEAPAGNEKRLIVTVYDSLDQVDVKVNGVYKFVINGYFVDLNFREGHAGYSLKKPIGFLYFKHENREGVFTRLVFTYAGNCMNIPIWWLLLIPVVIIILFWVLKRILIFAAIALLIAFFMMSGLSFGMIGNIISDVFHTLLN